MGLIVRTAGLNKTKNELNKDVINTIGVWEEIKEKAVQSIAPSLVYEEGDLIKRAIRDIYDNETNNIIVDGNEGYQKVKSFMKFLMPENVKKVKKYRGKIPLFHDAGIEKSLNTIFESTIRLESGGYIVINPTEALVSIDVNSGQSIKEANIEIKGVAHITGGGHTNIKRILPKNLICNYRLYHSEQSGNKSNETRFFRHEKLFQWIQKEANLTKKQMMKTFNCGVGMIVVVPEDSEWQYLSNVLKEHLILGELEEK